MAAGAHGVVLVGPRGVGYGDVDGDFFELGVAAPRDGRFRLSWRSKGRRRLLLLEVDALRLEAREHLDVRGDAGPVARGGLDALRGGLVGLHDGKAPRGRLERLGRGRCDGAASVHLSKDVVLHGHRSNRAGRRLRRAPSDPLELFAGLISRRRQGYRGRRGRALPGERRRGRRELRHERGLLRAIRGAPRPRGHRLRESRPVRPGLCRHGRDAHLLFHLAQALQRRFRRPSGSQTLSKLEKTKNTDLQSLDH